MLRQGKGWSFSVLLLAVSLAGCPTLPSAPSGKAPSLADLDASTPPGPDGAEPPDGKPIPPAVFSITKIDPPEGRTGGGELVVIEGAEFDPGLEVWFGSLQAQEVSVLSDIVIHARTPAHKPGLVDLRVKKQGGAEVVQKDAFLFRDPISATAIEPAEGSMLGGTALTIRGSGFTKDTRVLLGGRLAIGITLIDDGTLLCVSPPGATGVVDLLVSTAWTNASLQDAYRYAQPPALTGLDPKSGPANGATIVTLTGRGLASDATVSVGGEAATIVGGDGDTTLVIETHGGPVGPADVEVLTADGAAMLEGAFTFMPANLNGALKLLNVSPHTGTAADTVTLTGIGFDAGMTVWFGGQMAPVIAYDLLAGEAVVKVPGGAGSIDVTAEGANGESTLKGAFTYTVVPKVYGVSPSEGPVTGGSKVTIAGGGFEDVLDVTIGALPAKVVSHKMGELIVMSPPGSPGSASVRVVTTGGEALLEDAFTYLPLNGPEIYAVTPSYGAVAGNTLIHVYGAGLTGSGPVKFGDSVSPEVQKMSSTELRVRAPKAAEPEVVDVTVSSGGQTLTLSDAYSYFDPYSPYGGSWGPPVRGTVNITVLDIYETKPIESAFVMLWADPSTPHQGYTDDKGQITFSDVDIQGPQMVTAAKMSYTAFSVVQYDAENVTVHLIPFNPPTPGGGGGGPKVLPFGSISGKVTGLGKYIVIPPLECGFPGKNLIGAGGTSACQACAIDADCGGDGALCQDVAGEKRCTTPCASTKDCPQGYTCGGNGGNGQLQCIPSPGIKAAYCVTTAEDLWEDPPPAHYPSPYPNEDGTKAWTDPDGSYLMKARLGELAVLCFGGVVRDPANMSGTFEPLVMGVHRHLNPVPNGELEDIDIVLDIPLDKEVPLRLDGAPATWTNATSGITTDTQSTLKVSLDFGAEGFYEVKTYEKHALDRYTLNHQPTTLGGPLDDVTYAFLATVDGVTIFGPASAQSGTQAFKVKVLDVDRMFAFEDGAWAVVKSGIPRDVHGLWGAAAGDTWAVGAGGLIAHGKGKSWFPQASPTTSDLHGLFGTSASFVAAVGDKGTIATFDGVNWSLETSPTTAPLYAGCATLPEDAFAVGQGVVLHRGTAGWTLVDGAPATTLRGAVCPKLGELGAVGDDGKLWRYDGAWTSEAVSPNALRAIALGTDGATWAVGDLGGVFHRLPGAPWVQEDVPTTEQLNAVTLAQGGDVFAAGSRGTLLHFDGLGWAVTQAPKYGGDLRAVWTTGEVAAPAFAAGTQVVTLGPMLSFPEIHDPIAFGDGVSVFSYHLDWTVKPSAAPTFNFVEMLAGDFPVWWTIGEAMTQEVTFPNLPQIQGITPFPGGLVTLVVNRVLKPGATADNFDFWDMYDRGSWKSWSHDQAQFQP